MAKVNLNHLLDTLRGRTGNNPVIQRIERVAGCIRVEASDRIRVERILVTIYDEGGAVLERGSATQAAKNWWEYASFTEGRKIEAEAWDLSGNVTKYVL